MHPTSKDQGYAIEKVVEWYSQKNKTHAFITLGGYAGTGKTTTIAALAKRLHAAYPKLKLAFASYTGKATRVLKSKLDELYHIPRGDSVSTIHALMYTPVVDERQQIVGWKKKEALDCGLVIIDEASMVDGSIWRDLLSFKLPILAVGDHGQLPPIQGTFSLMAHPQILLSHIHRQARENPIIGLSIQARTHGYIRPGEYSATVKKISPENPDYHIQVQEAIDSYDSDTLFLCGYNKTRKKINQTIRTMLGFESPEPSEGDRVICLRNNHKKQIYNGMIGTVMSISSSSQDWYDAEIEMEDGVLFSGLISKTQFASDTSLNFTEKRKYIMAGDLFDFGYALTVHKAQGGQARKVILFEERFAKMSDEDSRRWLYTAVTRATEELIIFGR